MTLWCFAMARTVLHDGSVVVVVVGGASRKMARFAVLSNALRKEVLDGSVDW